MITIPEILYKNLNIDEIHILLPIYAPHASQFQAKANLEQHTYGVTIIRLDSNSATYFVPCFNSQALVKIKYSLLPMCVPGIRSYNKTSINQRLINTTNITNTKSIHVSGNLIQVPI